MSNLIWNLVKNNNCYKVTQKHAVFSSDPMNPTGRQTFSDCGLAQNKAVSLTAVDTKKNGHVSFNVAFKKRERYQQKSLKDNKFGVRRSFNTENLNVKSGVHTVAKKRFGTSKLASKNLKKLAKLNRASRK